MSEFNVRGDLMEFFTENPMIIVAIVIFIICVVIGFFGDQHFKKKKELKNNLNNEETKETSVASDNKNDNLSTNNVSFSSQEDVIKKDELVNSKNINPFASIPVNNMPISNNDNPFTNDAVINSVSTSANTNPFASDVVKNINQTKDNINPFESSKINSTPVNVVNNPFERNNSFPENSLKEPNGNPVPFDGQINNDENINNMF